MGLKADRYDVQLGDTIFKLMGLESKIDHNNIQESFYQQSKKVKALDITNQPKALESLVNEIYKWLKKESSKNEKA